MSTIQVPLISNYIIKCNKIIKIKTKKHLRKWHRIIPGSSANWTSRMRAKMPSNSRLRRLHSDRAASAIPAITYLLFEVFRRGEIRAARDSFWNNVGFERIRREPVYGEQLQSDPCRTSLFVPRFRLYFLRFKLLRWFELRKFSWMLVRIHERFNGMRDWIVLLQYRTRWRNALWGYSCDRKDDVHDGCSWKSPWWGSTRCWYFCR